MASTNVCRLDSSSSVNLFTVIGLICNSLVEYNFVCNFNGPLESKCTLGLVALEKAKIDLHAFKQQALSSLTAIKLKRPKVTGGEVGVSSDTIRARPKAKQSWRHM